MEQFDPTYGLTPKTNPRAGVKDLSASTPMLGVQTRCPHHLITWKEVGLTNQRPISVCIIDN